MKFRFSLVDDEGKTLMSGVLEGEVDIEHARLLALVLRTTGSSLLDMGLDELGLDDRAARLLREEGITTLKDLISKSRREILEIHKLGQGYLKKIEEKLAQLGFSLCA